MSSPQRSPLEWIVLALLAALVATNITFLILLRTGGPLIGLAFYLILLALTLRAGRRDHRRLVVGGLVGLAVHVVEVTAMGWTAYPLLVSLNLVLPLALALSAWALGQVPRHVTGDK